MSVTPLLSNTATVQRAVASVDDPEYPGLSIVDLGLVESVTIEADAVVVGLIPTFSGCPALAMIADDVVAAVEALPGVRSCRVDWLPRPVWTVDRLSDEGRRQLATSYTVTIRSTNGNLFCPVCGSSAVEDRAVVGSARCRSVAWCSSCRNPVEVLR